MASPLQSPSARRKMVYLALILGLFVVNTFFWRGVDSPLTGGQAPSWTVQGQATKLDLTEETQGEADVLGSTLRLVLTGSRGWAVTVLWQSAIDLQKKNEWNELEFVVRSLTKLQPHFLTPWLFQSWNLSYNVSVEADRVRDKYFYISRGIELLAQGERLNKNNPDMRYWIAFYNQNKFSVSDENSTLRSLFQLSCIPPQERNPNIIAPKDPKTQRRRVNEKEFEKFCQQHPQLVRRLREPPRELDLKKAFQCKTPEDVVDFLEENWRLPCRFFLEEDRFLPFAGKEGELKPGGQQFPVLPAAAPKYDSKGADPTAADKLDDTFGPFAAARAWFAYAQDPLPDPDPLADAMDRKERIKTLQGRRLPKQPAEVLFRQSPCRAQSYVGEYLQKEGWFDNSGWSVDAGRSGARRWFPSSAQGVVVGAGRDYAIESWTRAASMWREYGLRNGMLYESATQEITDQNLAEKFRQRFPQVHPDDQALSFRIEKLDKEMQEGLKAQRKLAIRGINLGMTNFMHHFVKANTEQDRDTAQARKTIDQAVWFSRALEPEAELKAYEEGFAKWKAVLLRHPNFRADSYAQEELYETELRYLADVQKYRGNQFRPAIYFQGLATAAIASATGISSPAPVAMGLIHGFLDERTLPLPILGPFDGVDDNLQPWIESGAIMTVRQRLHQDTPPQQQPQPPKPPPSETRRGGRG
jgi:hypothetical protein